MKHLSSFGKKKLLRRRAGAARIVRATVAALLFFAVFLAFPGIPSALADPLPEEEDACIGYLREQFRAIRPKVIVCLGRIAAKRMITPEFKITADHGKVYQKSGVLMMATFHPAAMLRNPAYKPQAFEDLERALELSRQ